MHIFQKFHSDGASIKKVDGFQMVKQMAAKIEIMMQHKIDAIKVPNLKKNLTIFICLDRIITIAKADDWLGPPCLGLLVVCWKNIGIINGPIYRSDLDVLMFLFFSE